MSERRERRSLRAAWRTEDSYGWVFFLLMVDIALLELLPSRGWARAVQVPFVAATLLLALRTSNASPRIRRPAQIGSAIVSIGAIGAALAGTDGSTGASYLLMSLMLLLTAPAILARLIRHDRVTSRTLIGALSVYLIIGLFFAFAFLGTSELNGGKLFAQHARATPADCVYFSYITEATVGYGDLTPVGNTPRLMAVALGLVGQIFLVTTVARLVSLYSGSSRRTAGPGDDPTQTPS